MKKFFLLLMMLSVFALAFSACSNGDNEDGIIEVTIPHYKTGDNTGALYFMPIVESFNLAYEGRFRLNIEPMPQHLYPEQLRLLAGQNMLPVLIEGDLDEEWFREVVIPNNMFVDLRPFFSDHPIYNYFNPDNYQHNLTDDGRLITFPHPIQRPMTMFYNEALFQPSRPINQMSWHDVAAELGDNRIAFMTAENAWTTMLAFTSMVAAQPGGAELLINSAGPNERIMDFNQPPLIAAFAQLQYLMANHAQPNAIGAPFAEAANAIFNLDAAIIANGPWMIGDFGPGGAENWGPGFNPDTIRASVLPGNVAVFNPLGYNWWIPSTATPEEQALATAFLNHMYSFENVEFMMEVAGGLIPGFDYSQAFLNNRAEDRLMNEYSASFDANTIIVPAFADTILSSVADMDFGTLLPLLINDSMTPEEFADALTQASRDAS